MTPTSPVIDGNGEEGDVILFKDKLKTKLDVGKSGRYDWHVNPSTRPLVDPRLPDIGRRSPASRPTRSSSPARPGPTRSRAATPRLGGPELLTTTTRSTVLGGQGIDNGKATVRITWPSPATDWDMKVFSDTDGDGTSEGETKVFGSSAQGPTNVEETTHRRPRVQARRVRRPRGELRRDGAIRRHGHVQQDRQARSIEQGLEKWTLTCRETKGGPVKARQEGRW